MRTRVLTPAGWRGLQEFLIVERGRSRRSRRSRSRASTRAAPTAEVLEALAAADAIVVGPSNPVISIGPILAVAGMREAIAASGAPVIAVSPFVAGRAVKGPTEKFMAAIGRPVDAPPGWPRSTWACSTRWWSTPDDPGPGARGLRCSPARP